ncbi:MAG: histidine triad nucleotide-binding protein [Limnochordia bacterium]|jgi:histidine triad (HIT) family protein|nr:histidine triad nucleotide-binding protein [Limnochordia bacterium]MDD2628728.1 histidine triad nucleotide-binding protein [Limnochordia bacterium]MDD4517156.1 histidine triad nucleotide-binding protein [Limnochordia bacterium]
MSGCLFCKIATGQVPADKVYEDELVVAFKDINPQAPVHLLIIPRKHIPSVTEIKEDDLTLVGHIHHVAAKLAEEQGIAKDGYRIVTNCGEQGGQTVLHVHFHLLGGRSLGWPPG